MFPFPVWLGQNPTAFSGTSILLIIFILRAKKLYFHTGQKETH